MIGSYPTELRIVRTWPGPGTGDSYYMTEDGRTWVTRPSYDPYVTGDTWGTVVGDRMITPPRSSGVPLYPRGPLFFDRPKPMPPADDVVAQPKPERPPRRLQRPVAGFVGAGPMKRRWR